MTKNRNVEVHQQYTRFQRFEGVLKSKHTKVTYLKSIKNFLQFSGLEDYTDL